MRFRKQAIGATVVLAMAATIAGCSSSDEPGPAATPSDSITIWNNAADSPALLDVYARFTEDTGIAVDLVTIPSDNLETTVLTKWATGDRPDILEYHAIPSQLLGLDPRNNMIDLSDMDFVAKSGDLYKDSAGVDGVVYGAITTFPQVWGLYYNKQVFADNGLEPPADFDDIADICTALAGSDVSTLFQAGGTQWPPVAFVIAYMGGVDGVTEWAHDVATNKAALDDDDSPWLAAVEKFKELQGDGCFNSDATTATLEQGMAAVLDGSTAMIISHSNMLPRLLTAANNDQALIDSNVGWTPVSATGATPSYSPGPLGTYYAPKTGDASHEAAALKFIEYVTGDAYQQYIDDSQTFPVIDGFTQPSSATPLLQTIKAAYDEGAVLAYDASIPGMGGFNAEVGRLLAGEVDPKQAAANMQSLVEQASIAAGMEGW